MGDSETIISEFGQRKKPAQLFPTRPFSWNFSSDQFSTDWFANAIKPLNATRKSQFASAERACSESSHSDRLCICHALHMVRISYSLSRPPICSWSAHDDNVKRVQFLVASVCMCMCVFAFDQFGASQLGESASSSLAFGHHNRPYLMPQNKHRTLPFIRVINSFCVFNQAINKQEKYRVNW